MSRIYKFDFTGIQDNFSSSYILYTRGREKLATQLHRAIRREQVKIYKEKVVELEGRTGQILTREERKEVFNLVLKDIPVDLEREVKSIAFSWGAGSIILDEDGGGFKVVKNFNPFVHFKS